MRPSSYRTAATATLATGLLLLLAVPFAVAAPPIRPDAMHPLGPSSAGGVLTVTITAWPVNGSVPLNVSLNATVSGGYPPYNYSWEFGDGTTIAFPGTADVTHTYRWIATFQANVSVTDFFNAPANASVNITVGPGPMHLSAQAVPPSIPVGSETFLETQISGGLPPYTFAWSNLPPGCVALAVKNLSCRPQVAGAYTITVTAKDSQGSSLSQVLALVVSSNGSGPTHPTASSASGGLPLWEILPILAVGAVVGGVGGFVLRRRWAERRRR
jgi:hypothetical protein